MPTIRDWNKCPRKSKKSLTYASHLIIIWESESEKWKWSHSVVSDSLRPQDAAYQAPPSVGFSRQESWSGVPFSKQRRKWMGFWTSCITLRTAGFNTFNTLISILRNNWIQNIYYICPSTCCQLICSTAKYFISL